MQYHGISKHDSLNGEGLRVVLWVSGCIHNCKGCHNPETHDILSGESFDEKAKEELFNALRQPYVKGLTLSGGDPLHPSNRSDILNLLKEIKQELPDKDIWLYSGFIFEAVNHLRIMEYIDVMVDGKFEKDLKNETVRFRGSSNQRVVDVQKSLKCGSTVPFYENFEI